MRNTGKLQCCIFLVAKTLPFIFKQVVARPLFFRFAYISYDFYDLFFIFIVEINGPIVNPVVAKKMLLYILVMKPVCVVIIRRAEAMHPQAKQNMSEQLITH